MYLCLIQYHLKEEVKKILFAVFRETVKIEKNLRDLKSYILLKMTI